MNIRFHINEFTGQPHVLDHGVTPVEAVEAMRQRYEDRSGDNDSRSLIGRTSGGRIIRVIYAPARQEHGVFVITAYELRGKPLAAFRRRQRGRGIR